MEGTTSHKLIDTGGNVLLQRVPIQTSTWTNALVDIRRGMGRIQAGIRDIMAEQVPIDTCTLFNLLCDLRQWIGALLEGIRWVCKASVPVENGLSEDRRWFLMVLLPLLCTVLVCVDREMVPPPEQLPVQIEEKASPAQEGTSFRMLPQNVLGAVKVTSTAVYAAADRESPQRLTLAFGNKVDPVDASGEWVSVKAGGTEGFVPRADLVLFHRDRKRIALTFDDGPAVQGTKHVLDVFQKNGARGTFFVIGNRIDGSTAHLLKRASALGCEIGNHSWDHAYLPGLKKKKIHKQLADTDGRIRQLIGHNATVIRPPYGAVDHRVKAIAGRPLILWSIDTLDWKYRRTDRLIKYVRKHKRDGAVVLMHDIHPSTVRAVDAIVWDLQRSGYELVTITELAAIRGEKFGPGTVYIGK